jgi:hypothetical protein
MAYFVFDLDETLGQLYTPYYFLCDLKTERYLKSVQPAKASPTPAVLAEVVPNAYKRLVQLVAAEELSDRPLGVLRPGILEVFQKIVELKALGGVKGVLIYSNNGSLPALEFTRDVIEEAVGSPGLFCDLIHWYHPTRKPELLQDPRTGKNKPGSADKTWAVLSKIMKEGPCGAPADLNPTQVYFFDDTVHVDLQFTLGGFKKNYIRVTPYKFKTSASRFAALHRQALQEAGILDNPEILNAYLDYVQSCMGKRSETIDKHIGLIVSYTDGTQANSASPPAPDEGFILMNTLLNTLLAKAKANSNAAISVNNNYQKQINTSLFEGGRRGRIVRRRVVTRKARRGSKKTRKSKLRNRK